MGEQSNLSSLGNLKALFVSCTNMIVKEAAGVCGFWWGRNSIFHFSFHGVIVTFCHQTCRVRCSIDEGMDWKDVNILKRLEISLHARKGDYKSQGNRDGASVFQELLQLPYLDLK